MFDRLAILILTTRIMIVKKKIEESKRREQTAETREFVKKMEAYLEQASQELLELHSRTIDKPD